MADLDDDEMYSEACDGLDSILVVCGCEMT